MPESEITLRQEDGKLLIIIESSAVMLAKIIVKYLLFLSFLISITFTLFYVVLHIIDLTSPHESIRRNQEDTHVNNNAIEKITCSSILLGLLSFDLIIVSIICVKMAIQMRRASIMSISSRDTDRIRRRSSRRRSTKPNPIKKYSPYQHILLTANMLLIFHLLIQFSLSVWTYDIFDLMDCLLVIVTSFSIVFNICFFLSMYIPDVTDENHNHEEDREAVLPVEEENIFHTRMDSEPEAIQNGTLDTLADPGAAENNQTSVKQ